MTVSSQVAVRSARFLRSVSSPQRHFVQRRWRLGFPHIPQRQLCKFSSTRALHVRVVLADDTELKPLVAQPGETLMEVLSRADVSDVWSDAGACGGACSCSTCRVVIDPAWRHAVHSAMPPPADDELDMLEVAAREYSRAGEKPWETDTVERKEREESEEEFLDGARLSCQISLTEELDGLTVHLVGVGPNMMEVPLWLRGR